MQGVMIAWMRSSLHVLVGNWRLRQAEADLKAKLQRLRQTEEKLKVQLQLAAQEKQDQTNMLENYKEVLQQNSQSQQKCTVRRGKTVLTAALKKWMRDSTRLLLGSWRLNTVESKLREEAEVERMIDRKTEGFLCLA